MMTTAESHAGVKVWLVDDSNKFRELIASLIERMNGVHCDRQFSSPTALLSALASKIGPDVILLDVQMGKENGVEAVRAIKSLARSTRVLMFTTCYDPELKKKALNEGASEFLNKTSPLDRLEECIRHRDESPKYPTPRRLARSYLATGPDEEKTGTNPISRSINFIRTLWN